ncbi:unnamed protein product [Lepidochelys olivacea]
MHFMLICGCQRRELKAKIVLYFGMHTERQCSFLKTEASFHSCISRRDTILVNSSTAYLSGLPIVLTRPESTSSRCSTHLIWLPVLFQYQFHILILIFTAINRSGSSCITDHLSIIHNPGLLQPSGTM